MKILAVFEKIFFQVPQFEIDFQNFLSFSAFKTVQMFSNCAYWPLLEFIEGQQNDFTTICCHKILVIFLFCSLFLKISVILLPSVINEKSDWLKLRHRRIQLMAGANRQWFS